MTFISILIALVIERFLHWAHLRNWSWFEKYTRWLSKYTSKWPSYLTLIICIVPVVFVVGFISFLLGDWVYGLLKLTFGVVILVYCLGPGNLWQQAYSCVATLNKEDPAAAIDRVQSTFEIEKLDNSQVLHQSLTRAIFIEGYKRVFAVILWFALLGPAGAVLYRLLTLCIKQSILNTAPAAKQVQQILDWIPARLFTFLFALGGHFTEVFSVWKKSFKQKPDANEKVIGDCGVVALDIMDTNKMPENGAAETEALALLDRALVMSLVVLAVIVLMI